MTEQLKEWWASGFLHAVLVIVVAWYGVDVLKSLASYFDALAAKANAEAEFKERDIEATLPEQGAK